MLQKQILATLVVIALGFGTTQAAYQTVECSSDPAFSANSCSQCFSGGAKGQGDNIGFLTDDWINDTPVEKIVFTEEQTMPQMVNLGDVNSSWTQIPSAEDFWQYTEEFKALHDDENAGHILAPGEQVTWLESQVGYAYKLVRNSVADGENVGMLVFPIVTHEILSDGNLTVDGEEHRECVLFTSGEAVEEEEVVQPTRLPDTGPAEFFILALLALLFGFGVLNLRKRTD